MPTAHWPGCAGSTGDCCPALVAAPRVAEPFGSAPLALALSFRTRGNALAPENLIRTSVRQYGHIWTHVEAIYQALLFHARASGSLPRQLFLPMSVPCNVVVRGRHFVRKIEGFTEALTLLNTSDMLVDRVPWVPGCAPVTQKDALWVYDKHTNATAFTLARRPPWCCTNLAWPLPYGRPELASMLHAKTSQSGVPLPARATALAQLNIAFDHTIHLITRLALRRRAWRALGVGLVIKSSANPPRKSSSMPPPHHPLFGVNTTTPEDLIQPVRLIEAPRLFTVVLSVNSSNYRRIASEEKVVEELRRLVEDRNAAIRARGPGGGEGSAGAIRDLLEFAAVDLQQMEYADEVCERCWVLQMAGSVTISHLWLLSTCRRLCRSPCTWQASFTRA